MFAADALTDELVQSAVAGSPVDRDRVLRLLAGQVRAMVVARLAPSPPQAPLIDEVTQQALLDIAEGLPTLRTPAVRPLKAFASTIVDRRVADYIRSPDELDGRPVRSLDSSLQYGSASARGHLRDLVPASGLSPRSAAARAEALREVVDELARLNPDHRDVITLAFIDQLPIRIVAERLALTRPATSMLLMRAISALQRRMTGSPDGVTPDGLVS